MRRGRSGPLGLLGLLALASASGAACGSSGNVPSGGTCYLAQDCAPGLFCFGVKTTSSGSTPGTCTNNANKAQPDASLYLDGGKLPQTDGPNLDTGPGKDSPAPAEVGTDTAPPVDTGPADMGTPPTDSGGA